MPELTLQKVNQNLKIEFLPCCIEKWNEYIAGSTTADRHGIVKEKTVEKLNAQLVSLVGENGAVMLISPFKSSKSISAPLRWLGKF